MCECVRERERESEREQDTSSILKRLLTLNIVCTSVRARVCVYTIKIESGHKGSVCVHVCDWGCLLWAGSWGQGCHGFIQLLRGLAGLASGAYGLHIHWLSSCTPPPAMYTSCYTSSCYLHLLLCTPPATPPPAMYTSCYTSSYVHLLLHLLCTPPATPHPAMYTSCYTSYVHLLLHPPPAMYTSCYVHILLVCTTPAPGFPVYTSSRFGFPLR